MPAQMALLRCDLDAQLFEQAQQQHICTTHVLFVTSNLCLLSLCLGLLLFACCEVMLALLLAWRTGM